MQVVVLIGGLGTRLYPLTYATPKSLLPLLDGRCLSLELEWLRANGATQVVLAVSHFAAAIADFLRDHDAAHGLRVAMRMETEPLGSGGALRNCADILQDDFLLLNGDILTDLDLQALIRYHRAAGAVVTATVAEVDNPRHYGILDVRDDGRTFGWQEKPAPEEARSRWGNVGAWAMSRGILDFIPAGRFVSLEKETFPLLFDRGVPFYAHRSSAYWKDIGTIDKYVQANRDALNGVIRGVAPRGREVSRGVWIDASAEVAADVDLAPPVVIGARCRIGTGAHVQGPSVIGTGTQVGAGARLDAAIVWPDARLGERVTVTDSVVGTAEIEPDAAVGAGCVLASNTIVRAGTRLPAGTVLGPGSRLSLA